MRTSLLIGAALLACSCSDANEDVPADARVDATIPDGTTPEADVAVDTVDTNAPKSSECPTSGEPRNPIEYGACAVDAAKVAAKSQAIVRVMTSSDPQASRALGALGAAGVQLDPRAESYAIVSVGAETLVVGRDAVGAMYGALDVAERLTLDTASALPLSKPIVASPRVPLRGANHFIIGPAEDDLATKWWFLERDFWREYLDMMAHARLDFLDLHGIYNVVVGENGWTSILLYFASSATYPNVGVPKADRAANLAMLNTIIGMAKVRGIKVGLMNYRSNSNPEGGIDPNPLPDADLRTYTLEASKDLATNAPGLDYLGFRIGESGTDARWYIDTFVAGVKSSKTTAKLFTRTWKSTKSEIMELVSAMGPGSIVEAKYNGEHLGVPYAIVGGSFATRWLPSYSYEDYLTPPAPYDFVFQIRAGGTHRMLRYASYERTRRTASEQAISPRVAGFSFEAAQAYVAQRDFYHVDPKDHFSRWTFRRDELSYLLFGRLGYDPTTSERVFRAALRARVGTDALWDAVQAAAEVVPWIQTAHTCGPDQQDFAPEFELGGTVGYFASAKTAPSPPVNGCQSGSHQPFDELSYALPYEAADDLVHGRSTTRISPSEVARRVLEAAKGARTAKSVTIDPTNAEARDYVRECIAFADLGDYFGHKLRGATALAVYAKTAKAEWLATAREETKLADDAWRTLALDTAYIKDFRELIRGPYLRLPTMHWRLQVDRLDEDPKSIDDVVAAVTASPPSFEGTLPTPAAFLDSPRAKGPGLASFDITPSDPNAAAWTVTVKLAHDLPAGASVHVLAKPFVSTRDFESVDAIQTAGGYTATIARTEGSGAIFAVEIVGPVGVGWRYPDPLRETPYRVIAP